MPREDARDAFAAVVSTHALLHGTPNSIALRLRWLSLALADGGLLFATFGCVRDARFGNGRRVDDDTFAPSEGDEAGVPHAYFSGKTLQTVLSPHFVVETLEEVPVDGIAGRWAHQNVPLRGAVHWFSVARRRDS